MWPEAARQHHQQRRLLPLRGDGRHQSCRALVRESALLPWAEELFEALDDLQPDEFADEVQRQLESGRAVRSPGAVTQLDATLERLAKRFEWGHVDEATYQAEWQRLQALRAEFTAAEASTEAPIVLDDTWWPGAPPTPRAAASC